MATCLVALGSNLGDREAIVCTAMTELSNVGRVARRSRLCRTRPVGGTPGQDEFINAAAVVETSLEPLPLLRSLQAIENRHARQRDVRWAARTLDLDLLLYDERTVDSAELVVPHPRMSFRRFVLEPAVEVADRMLHPTIGWTIDRLLEHLNTAADRVAILAPVEQVRRRLAAELAVRCGLHPIVPPEDTSLRRWPSGWTTWLTLEGLANRPPPTAPKLTIILDADAAQPAESADWRELSSPWDRGPTLVLRAADRARIDAEATAAVQAVWPLLCLPGPSA